MKWKKIHESGMVSEIDKKLLEKAAPFYDAIAACCKFEEIPLTEQWPFDHSLSLFGLPNESTKALMTVTREGKEKNEPAIWHIADELGIYRGCGNGHQAQVASNIFTKARYKFIDGEWYVQIDESNIKELSKSFGF